MGGGRCWRTRSMPSARGVNRALTKPTLISAGGVSALAQSRTTPPVTVAPSAICPHPSQQDGFAKTEPDD